MFEIELIICIKMDLALNNLQRLICHKTQTTNQPEKNTNQEELIIHFTNTLINIANKTIPKTTISLKHFKPCFTSGVQRHAKWMSSNPPEIQKKPCIRKFKQIQTTKSQTWCTIKDAKNSSWRTFTSKTKSNTVMVIYPCRMNSPSYK